MLFWMIWPILDLQIQDGRQFSAQKRQFFKVVIEASNESSFHAELDYGQQNYKEINRELSELSEM